MSRHRRDRGSSDRGARLGYRPALDGLRALAVLVVMLYHADLPWMRGGFLGVDVFFVLSGFLITSLLVQEWRRTGRIDVRAFWLRRARRLLPAVLVVLVAVAAVAVAVGRASPLLRGDALATLGYVSNWWFMASGQSYFARFLEPSPLRHTWSLAIEEQFYLVFPLLLVLLLSRLRLGLRGVRAVLVTGALGSALLMVLLYDPAADPSRVYYGSDTRVQALLVGAVLALSPALTSPAERVYTSVRGRLVPLPGAALLGWAALGGLAVMTVLASELSPSMYRGGFTLAAVLSAAVVTAVSRAPRSGLARLLSVRPLVAVGVLSYGLYLWHWPVFVVLGQDRTGLDGPALLALRFAVTAALALLSYRLVEEPIRTRRLQRRFTPTQWGRAVTASTVAVVATLVWATPSGPVLGSTPSDAVAGARAEPVPDAQGRLVTAFLLGDSQSFAMRDAYANTVDGLAVTGSTQLGCGTLLPERSVDGRTVPNLPACAEWEPRWTEEVARERPDLLVLMLGLGELYDREVDGRVLRFGTPAYREWLEREIDRRRGLVAGEAGRFALATVLCLRVSADASDSTTAIANDPERVRWLNDTIRAYGAAHPDVPVLDLYGTVCADGYTNEVDGVRLRDDGLHLNPRGAALVWRRIGPQMVAAAG